MSRLNWHFIDYPTNGDTVIGKTIQDTLVLVSWDGKGWMRVDECGNMSELTVDLACWAHIHGVPSTCAPMPSAR